MSALDPSRLFHTGVVVADIDAAMADYTNSLGLTWAGGNPVEHHLHYFGEDHDVIMRIAFSLEGPHHIELIEAKESTIWPSDTIGVHHLCYWSPDAPAAVAELEASGYVRLMGRPDSPGGYFVSPSGARIEVLTAEYHQQLLRWIGRVREAQASSG